MKNVRLFFNVCIVRHSSLHAEFVKSLPACFKTLVNPERNVDQIRAESVFLNTVPQVTNFRMDFA